MSERLRPHLREPNLHLVLASALWGKGLIFPFPGSAHCSKGQGRCDGALTLIPAVTLTLVTPQLKAQASKAGYMEFYWKQATTLQLKWSEMRQNIA